MKSGYFSGGTVEINLVNVSKHVDKNSAAGLEHGTGHYQGILALKYGFEIMAKFGGMAKISKRTFELAKYLYEELASMIYESGAKVVQLYATNGYQVRGQAQKQGSLWSTNKDVLFLTASYVNDAVIEVT